MWSALPEVLLGSTSPLTVIVASEPFSRLTGMALPVPVWVPLLS